MMLYPYLALSMSYAISFLLLAFLRRWHLLLLSGAGAVLLLWQAWRYIFSEESPRIMFATPMIILAFLGVVSGFFAATIVLSTRKYSRRWASSVTILPATFITVPAIVAGLFFWQQASMTARRPPLSPLCFARLHPVILGGAPLALPLTPAISVVEGGEHRSRYSLGIGTEARKFCEDTAAGPMRIANVRVEIDRSYSTRKSAFCSKAKPYGWWYDLCRREHDNPPSDYPALVSFYALGEYDQVKFRDLSADEFAKVKMADLPMRTLAGGVRRYADDRYIYFTRSDIPGYRALCYETALRNSDIYCVAGYKLTARIGIAYQFHSKAEDFPERSAIIDLRARDVIESLRQ